MFDAATDTAFRRSILEAPDDDAPRLVYADWLDEHGESDRAEFIRLQIRYARMSPGDPDRPALKSVVDQIGQAHHVEWVNQLPQFDDVHWEIFDRGFISAVRFDSPDAFFAAAKKVFAAAPIREVRLHQFRFHHAERLAESPYLTQIRTLDLNDGNLIANQGVEALMGSPQLSSLTELKLGGNSLGSAGLRAIAQSPYVRGLERLDLQRNDVWDDGLKYLAASPTLAGLGRLDLERTRTGNDGVLALARSKHLTRLNWLHLGGNTISDRAIVGLAGSPVVAELRDLFLHSNDIRDRGAAALAEAPGLGKLLRLFLRHNQIRDDGAIAIAASPYLGRLQELQLGENRISDWAGDKLRARFGNRVNLY
ncbi:MAG: TIGR02996 domain-containing protein [Zavarzinella sp.]|nr:TIGR02996 domain-containing protein [Zavarzinella sp.]